MQPDYGGGSLVNLMASITQSRGGKPLHALLKNLRMEDLQGARNVVLLIIDGLGDRLLAKRAPGGELARRRRGSMTSVFPSTTASAITTSYTGRTPLEHGLTGWFTYFSDAGCVAAALPFKSRGDMLPLSARGVTPRQIYTAESLFATLPSRSFVVTDERIAASEYNVRHCAGAAVHAYRSVDEMVSLVAAAVKSADERKFVYAYWPDYDAASHQYGCESAEALSALAKIDEAFGRLISALSTTDSVVIATADHGFLDCPREDCLELPAALASQLRFPLCGERRVVFCHVHSEKEFVSRAKEWLGERAEVRPGRELVEDGWFGDGAAHPQIRERVGDVAIVMRDGYTLKDWLPGEARHLHIGNHGGTSEDEMTIPLILEKT
ncbi:MAG TPA: alkaline phosphatase family protein [Burkholderiales bacterium]|nr:alkaline phosphatase family protein [Burkholderiales bacterium]